MKAAGLHAIAVSSYLANNQLACLVIIIIITIYYDAYLAFDTAF